MNLNRRLHDLRFMSPTGGDDNAL